MALALLKKKKQHMYWKPMDAFFDNKKEDFEIYSRETFIHIYDYEQKRAERTGTEFSLLIFSFSHKTIKMQYIKSLISLLKKNIRVIDHLGWCSADKLAIILPGTDFNGTELLMNKIGASKEYSDEFCEMIIEAQNPLDI